MSALSLLRTSPVNSMAAELQEKRDSSVESTTVESKSESKSVETTLRTVRLRKTRLSPNPVRVSLSLRLRIKSESKTKGDVVVVTGLSHTCNCLRKF